MTDSQNYQMLIDCVWVNTYRAVSPIAEFGRMKGYGYGSESGFQAMYDYTRPKTLWMNSFAEPVCGAKYTSNLPISKSTDLQYEIISEN